MTPLVQCLGHLALRPCFVVHSCAALPPAAASAAACCLLLAAGVAALLLVAGAGAACLLALALPLAGACCCSDPYSRGCSTYCSPAGIAPNLMMTTSLPDAACRKISPLMGLICHLDPPLVHRHDVAAYSMMLQHTTWRCSIQHDVAAC